MKTTQKQGREGFNVIVCGVAMRNASYTERNTIVGHRQHCDLCILGQLACSTSFPIKNIQTPIEFLSQVFFVTDATQQFVQSLIPSIHRYIFVSIDLYKYWLRKLYFMPMQNILFLVFNVVTLMCCICLISHVLCRCQLFGIFCTLYMLVFLHSYALSISAEFIYRTTLF